MLAQEQELEWELERCAEQMLQDDQLDLPGIPGENRWFVSFGQARKAALLHATQLGGGHRIAGWPADPTLPGLAAPAGDPASSRKRKTSARPPAPSSSDALTASLEMKCSSASAVEKLS